MNYFLSFTSALLLYSALSGCANKSLNQADLGAKTIGEEQVTTMRPAHEKPNIIVIYIDDLGFGDLSSYGAIGVTTPNVDKLVEGGVKLTDAHASAATCTPSRYSLLTGEYAFRNKAQILKGDAPLIIPTDKPTLPAMLREEGYTTGVVGKWHLGLGDGNLDWNGDVKPGPLEVGFDYSFLLPATGDRVPTVYLDGHNVVGLDKSDPITVSYVEKVGDRPTGYDNPELLRFSTDDFHDKTIIHGVSRIGYMDGGESALWVDEDFPEVFTDKAVGFIRDNKDRPFFLFHSFHDIHVPRLPHKRFQGKSDMGWRGDAIVQMDWMTGEITKELEALGLDKNTIIVFTSDNGPVLDDGYGDGAVADLGDHKPGGPFSGGKYSAFEAGTRVPTIVYWPGQVKPAVSDALLSQVDLYASFAGLIGADLDPNEAVDSRNLIDAFFAKTDQGREFLFKESVGTVSLRKDEYKYIRPVKRRREPKYVRTKGIKSGFSTDHQLYDLAKDPGETVNIAKQNPELVDEMVVELKKIMKAPKK